VSPIFDDLEIGGNNERHAERLETSIINCNTEFFWLLKLLIL